MEKDDELDVWRDDAARLAELLTTALATIKALAIGKGIEYDQKRMIDLATDISLALGIHLTIKSVLPKPD